MKLPYQWRQMVGAKRPPHNVYVGRAMRRPFDGHGGGEIVVVKTQSSFFVHERGMEQGYTDDRGWVVELRARDATAAEKAAFINREGR
jgi:hypothetical protein